MDGVLLSFSYLSKSFDVLSIAVSGTNIKELKISHFLQLKETDEIYGIFGNKLLSPQDYLDGYLKTPEKFRQDYHALLDFSRELNERFHILKIAENRRSLLISCILIALDNNPFRKAYKEYDEPKDLAKFLVDTVVNELRKSNIARDKLNDLKIQFGFIETETSLVTKTDVLKDLIEEIDENINRFIKTHEFYDVLGQLYIEFLTGLSELI